MAIITKTSSGEYYVSKTRNKGIGKFLYRATPKDKSRGVIDMKSINVPEELQGKKLMFKVEVFKEKKKSD